MNFPIPKNEAQRVIALHEYQVLDTEREQSFDNLTDLASAVANCKMAYISFIDKERQWIKASCQLPHDFRELPRDLAICSHSICQSTPLMVEDLLADDRFKHHPMLQQQQEFRFYCGVPLIDDNGNALGSLCVLDSQPKLLNKGVLEQLQLLAKQTLSLLELHKSKRESEELKIKQQQAVDETEALLLNILPQKIATELSETGQVKPRYFESVTVMFADFINTATGIRRQPIDQLNSLSHVFSVFDELTSAFTVEKIKTNKSQYLSASGLPDLDRAHAIRCLLAALSMQRYLTNVQQRQGTTSHQTSFSLHSGPVIAGVVGKDKYVYDLWGDSVNVSARILETCKAGEIRVSEASYFYCREYFEFENLGKVPLKHLPESQLFLLKRLKPEYSYDPAGYLANKSFLEYIDRI